MSHHSCLCAPSLRCLSCLGEYGLSLVRVSSFPTCLLKSQDEIFLRGESCHSPEKKKRKKIKIPHRAPPVSLSLSSLCSARGAPRARVARRRRPTSCIAPRAVHPCVPCQSLPPLIASRPGPVPLQTLTPLHHWCRRRAPVAAPIRRPR